MAVEITKQASISTTLRAHLELFAVTNDRPGLRSALADAIANMDAEQPQDAYVDMDDIGAQVRACFLSLIQSVAWRVLMMLAIWGAVIVSMLLEPNADDISDTQQVLLWIDFGFVMVFTIESSACIAALGVRGYITADPLGFLVVLTSWLEIMFRELSLGFTGFRALRLVRPLLMVQMFSGLKAIFDSLYNNASQIVNVVVVLGFFFTLFAVTGQQMFTGSLEARCCTATGMLSEPELYCHSTDCPEGMSCQANFGNPAAGLVGFDNFGQAMLALFVVSTFGLDSMGWVQQAWQPALIATAYYLVVLVIVALVINNLFVALVCFGFSRSSQDIAKELDERAAAAMASMDGDGDNLVSIEEFMNAGGTKEEFAAADLDGDGTLDRDEMRQREVMLHQKEKYGIESTGSTVEAPADAEEEEGASNLGEEGAGAEAADEEEEEEEHMCIKLATTLYTHRHFDAVIMTAILANTVLMAMVYDGMSDGYMDGLEVAETCFTVFFMLEMAIKLGALGVGGYTQDGWNLMDGCIVVIGLLGIFVSAGVNISFMRLLRVLRIAKTLRGLRDNKDVQALLRASLGSGIPMLNNLLFLSLLMTMFGLLGMPLFGNLAPVQGDRRNFDSFPQAMLTLFQVLTADGWDAIMYSCMKVTNGQWFAPVYFVVYYILGAHIALNLFIASVLECFEAEDEEVEEEDEDEEEHKDEEEQAYDGPTEQSQQHTNVDSSELENEAKEHNSIVAKEDEDDEELSSESASLSCRQIAVQLAVIPEEPKQESQLELTDNSSHPLSDEEAYSEESEEESSELAMKRDTFDAENEISEKAEAKSEDDGVFRLREEDIQQLEEAFKLFDTDGSNEMDVDELGELLQSLGMKDLTQKQLEDMVAEVDTDGGGEIGFDEFIQMMSGCPDEKENHQAEFTNAKDEFTKAASANDLFDSSDALAAMRQPIQDLFNVIDVDGGGSLDPDEMLVFINSMAKEGSVDAKAIFNEIDADGDGDITFDEFLDWSADPQKQTEAGLKFLQLIKLAPEPYLVCGMTVSANALWVFSPTNGLRGTCQQIATNSVFEAFVLVCILVSCVILSIDSPNASDETKDIVEAFDMTFMAIFTIEMGIKVIAFGFYMTQPSMVQVRTPDHLTQASLFLIAKLPLNIIKMLGFAVPKANIELTSSLRKVEAYWHTGWNRLDGTIVLFTWLTLTMEWLPPVKILRLGRTLRPLRLINKNPEIQKVMVALVECLRPLGAVCLLAAFVFLIFGIMGLVLFMGLFFSCNDEVIYREECVGSAFTDDGVFAPRVWSNPSFCFDNIMWSTGTLFEVSTLDGWSEVMDQAMDVTEHGQQPSFNNSWFASFYFVGFVLVGSILLTQIFVAVVIVNYQRAQGQVLSTAQMIHRDVSLMVGAMWGGRQPKPSLPPGKFRQFCYNCTVDCFPHTRGCTQPHHGIHRHFDDVIMMCVAINVIMIATEHHNQSSEWERILDIQNIVFLGIFSVEMAMKLAAHGFKEYWGDSWNRFDGIVVIASWIATIEPSLWPFRLVRALRMLRAASKVPELRMLVETIVTSLINVSHIFVVLLLVFFIWACVGMNLFGRVKLGTSLTVNHNFRYFGDSFLVLVHVLLGAWTGVQHDCWVSAPDCTDYLSEDDNDCGPLRGIVVMYFYSFILVASYIFLNLFVAVVLENFTFTYSLKNVEAELGLNEQDLDNFMTVWEKFDVELCGSIALDDGQAFVEQLGPPLSKSAPIPEFWLDSILMQLSTKAESSDTEEPRVALLDVAMSFVTRVLGIEAMSEEDKQLYLESIRRTGGSLLGCLGKQIIASGRLQAVCADYKKYQYEKAVAAAEERILAMKRELEAENARAQTKTSEEHLRQTMSATRAVLSQLNPTDPELKALDLFLDPCDMGAQIALLDAKLAELQSVGLPDWSLDDMAQDPPTDSASTEPKVAVDELVHDTPTEPASTEPKVAAPQCPEAAALEDNDEAVSGLTSGGEKGTDSAFDDASMESESVESESGMGDGVVVPLSEYYAILAAIFERYDYNESGKITEHEDLLALTFNVCYKLHINKGPAAVEQAVAQVKLVDGLTLIEYESWFSGIFANEL